MPINEKIRYARQQAHLSQQKLADAVGVKQSTVAAWESGRNEPDAEMIRTIAVTCGVTADFLVGMPADYAGVPDAVRELAEKMATLSAHDRSVLEKVIAAMMANEAEEKNVTPLSRGGSAS